MYNIAHLFKIISDFVYKIYISRIITLKIIFFNYTGITTLSIFVKSSRSFTQSYTI